MYNSELSELQNFKNILEHYEGFTARLRNIFNYHYDQIMREIEVETSHIPEGDKTCILDMMTEYMEEFMGWPSIDGTKEFIQDLTRTYEEEH